MTTFAQHAELGDLNSVTGSMSVSTASGGSVYNSSNARAAIVMTTSGTEDASYFESDAFSSAEFWTHFKFYFGFQVTQCRGIKFYAGGTARLSLKQSGSSTGLIVVEKNDGGYTTLGTSAAGALVDTTLTTYDIYIKLGNPGTITIYKNGSSVFSDNTLNLTWSGVTAFDKVRFGNWNNDSAARYSEVIIADWNTIGSKLVTKTVAAAGNYSAWTNTYTNVDEVVPTADYILSATANQRFSATIGAFPALASGESIESVAVHSYAGRDAGGPQNINHFLRISATDYDGSDKTLAVGLTGRSQFWQVSPATSVAFTVAELNAAEIGVRSRA